MSYRLLHTSLLTTALAIFATGCVDLNQTQGCTSDSQCRFDRICSEVTGQCINPQTSPGTIENEDATDVPQTDAGFDVDVTPDVSPEDVDAGPGEPDVTPTEEVGVPDADEPDVESCRVVAEARAKRQNDTNWSNSLSVRSLATVRFDATPSEGDIIGYEWSVLDRPAGSTSRLLPAASSPSPRLFIDVLGFYSVQLTVFGQTASGTTCQDTDIVEVQATPGDALHIQLTWDTPGDPDQTDTFGADLDLHYLHPNGRFGQPPWDIFWPNPTSDWGVEGDPSDDPSLDIDDTDGAGPENITHNRLETVDYEIGVYLTNHEDLGPSFATVRIYHHGQLVLELENRHMADLAAFWHVAKFNGNGQVTPIDDVLDGYPFL